MRVVQDWATFAGEVDLTTLIPRRRRYSHGDAAGFDRRHHQLALCGDLITITEVAQNAGSGDLPHFDKVFKRYTGTTPSAYRSFGN